MPHNKSLAIAAASATTSSLPPADDLLRAASAFLQAVEGILYPVVQQLELEGIDEATAWAGFSVALATMRTKVEEINLER